MCPVARGRSAPLTAQFSCHSSMNCFLFRVVFCIGIDCFGRTGSGCDRAREKECECVQEARAKAGPERGERPAARTSPLPTFVHCSISQQSEMASTNSLATEVVIHILENLTESSSPPDLLATSLLAGCSGTSPASCSCSKCQSKDPRKARRERLHQLAGGLSISPLT